MLRIHSIAYSIPFSKFSLMLYDSEGAHQVADLASESALLALRQEFDHSKSILLLFLGSITVRLGVQNPM